MKIVHITTCISGKTVRPCFAALVGVVLLMSLQSGCQHREKKTYVVGIVNPSAGLDGVVKGFRDGMTKRGYREGENITYLYDGPLGGTGKVDAVIAAMLEKKADLIYALSTPASKKLGKALAGTDVSGVFGPVFDPVESGIVASLSHPGGRITGVKVRGSTPKALEWLLAIVPRVKRIYVPFHRTDEAACGTVEDLRTTAAKFGIRIMTRDIATEGELETALADTPPDADALWMTCSQLLYSNVDKIVDATVRRKIPSASSTHSPYKNGILVSYGEKDAALGDQVSRLADKLLKGADPGNLPVETADYTLGINLRTARAIGITVPADVLKQADFVVR